MTKTKKPRVYFCDSPSGIYLELSGYAATDRHYPVAVIPCRTKKEARAYVRFASMSEGAQRYALAKEIARVQLGVDSLSDAGFKGMKSSRIVECISLADAALHIVRNLPTP